MFEGHLNEEEEVLQWLITQKTEDRIELITRQMLETMVEETQYLAVYFCKSIPRKNFPHFDSDFVLFPIISCVPPRLYWFFFVCVFFFFPRA